MGIDRTIHLEAFIKIPIQYTDYIKTIRTCGKHVNYKNDIFCPLCGDEIKEENKSSKAAIWCDELIGNNNFWNYVENETMYLFSNLYNCGVNTEENIFIVIDENIIKEKILLFKDKHGNDIKLLETKLKINIKVEFGFVYDVR